MTRLILLNGAPAVGKSTLARRYAEDHPFAFRLDIDQIRRMLGRWREDPNRAGVLARSLAFAAAGAHLESGHDVVVPQLAVRIEFIERLAAIAAEADAEFHEVFLLDEGANIVRRFAERTELAADPTHVDAHETLAEGNAGLLAYVDRFAALVPQRPDAVSIECVPGDIDATYQRLLEVLGDR
ncbi:ATP-binding protein [Glycomyces sp. TRM65418]|uniref:AAA family ATPase n=1 Tax=Glycomyces sp. TRM65418 TaxID=2867006 RepID=UPI001CE69F8E|nr:AAA family ATPase [Glycomyces sp. TRM65418]MCC3763097.1 ATP-binding protein [Glycomyces sp. TRM65418]QZD57105.1 ATP-binding protein [Glycomyces sp. TRM65418]